MGQLIKFGFICGLVISNNAFCLEPVQGLYFGVGAEVSHASPNPQLSFNNTNFSGVGDISLGPVGGGFNMSLGYRINNVRLEGEFLLNVNNYGELQVGSCTLISPSVVGPQGTCPSSISNDTGIGLGFNGNALGLYGLFNVYYDFLSADSEKGVFPYIGLGLGGAMIRNTANFENNEFNENVDPETGVTFHANSSEMGFAAQAIIGVGYYMDDFATIGLDFRYTSTITGSNSNSSTINTTSSSNGFNSRYGIATINLTGTFALEKTT